MSADDPGAVATKGHRLDARAARLMLGLLLVVFLLVVVKTAWIGDDAYITFRTVDNWVNGFGLRWNPAERVQSYTNTLWMFVVAAAYFVTGEIYLTAIFLGVSASVAAVGLLAFRASTSNHGALLVLCVLIVSKAFVEYSTSGLENPLVHLLMVPALLAYLRCSDPDPASAGRAPFLLALCTGLMALTRLDAMVLMLPVLVAGFLARSGWESVRAMALGFVPLVLWELFSLVYYGLPVPNTVYAKLSSGIPKSWLVPQGLRFFENSFLFDPVTLAATLLGIVCAFRPRESGGRRLWPIGVGIVMHLGYVLWIGGGFMSGRFLTVPLFGACFLIVRTQIGLRPFSLAALAVIVTGLLCPRGPLRTGPTFGDGFPREEMVDAAGISDERLAYFQYTGLFSGEPMEEFGHVSDGHPLAPVIRAEGPQVRPGGWIGILGYWCGPQIHWVDKIGLADPLLSHIPIYHDGKLRDPDKNAILGLEWRIGHYYREPPPGYQETLESGENVIESKSLAAYYDVVREITRGPLWSGARLRAIVELNLGKHEHLIEAFLEGE